MNIDEIINKRVEAWKEKVGMRLLMAFGYDSTEECGVGHATITALQEINAFRDDIIVEAWIEDDDDTGEFFVVYQRGSIIPTHYELQLIHYISTNIDLQSYAYAIILGFATREEVLYNGEPIALEFLNDKLNNLIEHVDINDPSWPITKVV